MAETMQQEKQAAAFPEIKDTADGYAEYAEDYGTAEEQDSSAIDVDIEDMVWEVETEPADDYAETEDNYSEEVYNSHTYEEEEYGRRPEMYEEIPYSRKMNKHIFTWIFSLVCGVYGVDRFVRGQVPLGIIKLLTFGGFGIWYLADLGVAIYKSYIEPGAEMQEDLHFDSLGRYV